MWPPELETLDQLQGGDLPLILVRRIFNNDERCQQALLAMLESKEIRIVNGDNVAVPNYRWRTALSFDDRTQDLKVSLLEAGARRIG
jgi:hypothetical protein